MVRYKLTIEYDGTNYSGWQKQENRSSIQETIENCFYNLYGKNIELFVSGRTDSGVHAINQVAHFDLDVYYSEDTIVNGLNFYLGENNRKLIKNLKIDCKLLDSMFQQDIVIKKCEVVNSDFHARFSAKMRYYRYIILNRPEPSALLKNRVWHIKKELNISKMQDACKLLIGKYDFSSFRDSQCQAKSPIKTIDNCFLKKEEDLVIFEINAKSFLHHMVRNIVGTLRDVGINKTSLDDFKSIIESKNRQNAGEMAKACGLYLNKIEY